jgi:hypothetical protein
MTLLAEIGQVPSHHQILYRKGGHYNCPTYFHIVVRHVCRFSLLRHLAPSILDFMKHKKWEYFLLVIISVMSGLYNKTYNQGFAVLPVRLELFSIFQY